MVYKVMNFALEKKLISKSDFEMTFDGGGKKVISFVNPFSYDIIAKEPNLIDEIDYWFVDGQALCFLTNLTRNNHLERASFDFSSLAGIFFERAISNDTRVGIVGGSQDELDKAISNIVDLYPKLNITYYHHGFMNVSERAKVIEDMNRKQIDMLVVGMGTPLQEEFSLQCINNVDSLTRVFTCGGFISQTADKADFYHPIVKKLGLRWLQRAIVYKHVRRRLVYKYPKFIFSYLCCCFSTKNKN
jgi:N-acetylglucosaminyldiphosphoundecaprenol N-acetyl-beta-D-mannosaminyltransferase